MKDLHFSSFYGAYQESLSIAQSVHSSQEFDSKQNFFELIFSFLVVIEIVSVCSNLD